MAEKYTKYGFEWNESESDVYHFEIWNLKFRENCS